MSNFRNIAILLFLSISFLITANTKSTFDRKSSLITTDTSHQDHKKDPKKESIRLDRENNSIPDIIPANFDWRTMGAVTRVKNQDFCSDSDWAFSALGALESQLFLKNNTLVELSEQELIDCSKINGNYGCAGGNPRNAFHYIENNGIRTQQAYPYQGQDSDICRNKELKGAKIAKNSTIIFTKISPGRETEMKNLVHSKGPILATIDSSADSLLSYEGGIYDDENCAKIGDHHVLIVGYGVTDQSKEFWIVKNSWSENWGENGYIRIARNKNICGIAANASYIEVVL